MIRVLLQIGVIPPATLILGLAAIVLCPLERSGRLFQWLSGTWSALLLKISGVRVDVSGNPVRLADSPAILVANHCSHLDPPVLIVALAQRFYFIAKRVLFFVPVFGQAIWAAGVIPIDRGNREKAVRSMDRAADRVNQGQSVMIFPEGTRSRDGQLQRFKKGAFILAIQAGVPIVPVVVTGSGDLLPRGGFFVRPGVVGVKILAPIPTEGMTFNDRDRLMEQTAAAMRAALAQRRSPTTEAVPGSASVVAGS